MHRVHFPTRFLDAQFFKILPFLFQHIKFNIFRFFVFLFLASKRRFEMAIKVELFCIDNESFVYSCHYKKHFLVFLQFYLFSFILFYLFILFYIYIFLFLFIMKNFWCYHKQIADFHGFMRNLKMRTIYWEYLVAKSSWSTKEIYDLIESCSKNFVIFLINDRRNMFHQHFVFHVKSLQRFYLHNISAQNWIFWLPKINGPIIKAISRS